MERCVLSACLQRQQSCLLPRYQHSPPPTYPTTKPWLQQQAPMTRCQSVHLSSQPVHCDMMVSSSTPGYLSISYLSVKLVHWRDTWLPVHLIPECEVGTLVGHLVTCLSCTECEVGTLVGHLVTCPSHTECEVAMLVGHLVTCPSHT